MPKIEVAEVGVQIFSFGKTSPLHCLKQTTLQNQGGFIEAKVKYSRMWFYLIPSFSAIMACHLITKLSSFVPNMIFYGNPYARVATTVDETRFYLRDIRLSGNVSAYKQIGLASFDQNE